jgi:hemin uptake protein HemP
VSSASRPADRQIHASESLFPDGSDGAGELDSIVRKRNAVRAPTDPSDVRDVAVETILRDQREAVLVHNGVRYRLRITSNNKLILTK